MLNGPDGLVETVHLKVSVFGGLSLCIEVAVPWQIVSVVGPRIVLKAILLKAVTVTRIVRGALGR